TDGLRLDIELRSAVDDKAVVGVTIRPVPPAEQRGPKHGSVSRRSRHDAAVSGYPGVERRLAKEVVSRGGHHLPVEIADGHGVERDDPPSAGKDLAYPERLGVHPVGADIVLIRGWLEWTEMVENAISGGACDPVDGLDVVDVVDTLV